MRNDKKTTTPEYQIGTANKEIYINSLKSEKQRGNKATIGKCWNGNISTAHLIWNVKQTWSQKTSWHSLKN